MHQPFITREILTEKAKRSKLETIFRRSRLPCDLSNLKSQARHVAKLISHARTTYFKSIIARCSNQPKKLWSCFNSLLCRSSPTTLPSTQSNSDLASAFLDFFSAKIAKLSAAFSSTPVSPSDHSSSTTLPVLSTFKPATLEEVRAAIMQSSNSSCSLDTVPTFLLKSCLEALLQPITNIVNLSLIKGTFPLSFKHAILRPLLKKSSLPHEDLSSYRPVSNLNFISKVIEKIVATRLSDHLNTFSLRSPFQSAYRKFHSIETALLRISNDILLACEQQKVTALVLLDLSAAFDTIDHSMLLSRLSTTFGITGSALDFFTSYLSHRTQSVLIGSDSSPPSPLCTGVPQGSVLGPLLFCLYTTPLSTILSAFPVTPHFYADDTQLYISFSATELDTSLRELTATLDLTHI